MLGVLLTLLYTYTMPIIYYSTTCMLPYPHLLAKRPEIGIILQNLSAPSQETCLHGDVKVCWRALQSCWECY